MSLPLQAGAWFIAAIAGGVVAFSFTTGSYCLVALTGIGGLQAAVGANSCDRYFAALAALSTPTIAAAAALVAYQQHRTSRAALMSQLYERKVLVLRGIQAFLSSVIRDGTVKGEELQKLAAALSEQHYLFNQELSAYLDEFRRRAQEALTVEIQLRARETEDADRDAVANRLGAAVLWLIEQQGEVRRRFEPHLRIVI